ncbi:GNAT family N-acetyltransferase [Jeotgalibaca sp. MA1X17-3]|uniref:GNAT family N-acetyltransferase n=1 Tax=Jeotgalibaca sp. MA1X17-3 TaxID=2908211 RepID=UPI001F2752C2|nr:GNAT family N-acetyltransferase [Jeotgalibaca sp. MA1X17-3]UJF16620.1 GNAT family N-acetyltransferase [Jeotgalibaca sp. MA1X17-3]
MKTFKKVDLRILQKTIDDIFKEQDMEVFEKELEKKEEKISIGAYDGENLIGGIVAVKAFQRIHIELLAISNEYRGQNIGSKLLSEVENIARELDIINLTLTTRSYQAEDFYKKNGFTKYGTLEDMPVRGINTYYFNKRLIA